jgi:hypothetical protein
VSTIPLELKDLIGPGVAVVAVIVGLLQYRSNSQSEFTKPLREAQLKLYQEASSAAAQIATLQPETPGWTTAKQNFLTLYYGPMAILEQIDSVAEQDDKTLSVEDAMYLFKSCMDDEQQCNILGSNLKDLSLALAHTRREELGREWGYELQQLKGEYQKRAIKYRAQLLAKINRQTIEK